MWGDDARLDMLVAGYEQQFNESLRYWRTRFVVIPTLEPPTYTGSLGGGVGGDRLNEEEVRILGIEKLMEIMETANLQQLQKLVKDSIAKRFDIIQKNAKPLKT